jgi:hypothetical protein
MGWINLDLHSGMQAAEMFGVNQSFGLEPAEILDLPDRFALLHEFVRAFVN